jgi:hypothetical protein
MQTIAFGYDAVFLFRSFRGNNMSTEYNPTEYNPKTAGPRGKTSARKPGYSVSTSETSTLKSETSALGSKTFGAALLSPVSGTQ